MPAGITTLLDRDRRRAGRGLLVTVESLTLGAAAVPHRERASAALRRADPAASTSRPRRTGHGADREGNRRRHPQHRLPPPARGPRRGASGGGRADRRVDPLLRPPARASAPRRAAAAPPAEPGPGPRRRAGSRPTAAQPRSARASASGSSAPRPGRGREGLRGAQHPGDLRRRRRLQPDLLRPFPRQAGGVPRRLRPARGRRPCARRGAAAAAEEPAPEAVGAGLRALLEHAAEDDLFARLAFFELPMAGPAALDQADRTPRRLHLLLRPPGGAGGRRGAAR